MLPHGESNPTTISYDDKVYEYNMRTLMAIKSWLDTYKSLYPKILESKTYQAYMTIFDQSNIAAPKNFNDKSGGPSAEYESSLQKNKDNITHEQANQMMLNLNILATNATQKHESVFLKHLRVRVA